MICDNFENGECRYYKTLIGIGEEGPTGMEWFSGRCKVGEKYDDWDEVEPEDCDMLDLVEGDEDDA